MQGNDIKKIKNLMDIYNSSDQAERYLRAKTNKLSLNREYSVVFSNLHYDFNNKKVMALDIGCNSGRYVAGLLGREIDTIGIDSALIPLKLASENYGPRFVRASATDLPFKRNVFDIIICIELLHHLNDNCLKAALSHINYSLKPGGVFIFDIKNKFNFPLWYTYKRKDNNVFPLKARTISGITELIRQYGFTIEEKKGIFFPIALFAPYVVIFAKKIN